MTSTNRSRLAAIALGVLLLAWAAIVAAVAAAGASVRPPRPGTR